MPVVFSLLFSETGLARKARSSKKPCPTGHDPPPSSPPPPQSSTPRRSMADPGGVINPNSVQLCKFVGWAFIKNRQARADREYWRHTYGGEPWRGTPYRRPEAEEKRAPRDATTATTTTTTTTTTRDDDDDVMDDAEIYLETLGIPRGLPTLRVVYEKRTLGEREGKTPRPIAPGERFSSRHDAFLQAAPVVSWRDLDAGVDGEERRPRPRPRPHVVVMVDPDAPAPRTAGRRHLPGAAGPWLHALWKDCDGDTSAAATAPGEARPRARRFPSRTFFLSPPARNSFLFSPPVVPRFRRSVSTLGFDAFDPRPSTLIRARPRTRRTYRASPGCSCRTTARRRRAGIIGTCSCCSSRRTTRRFARMGAALKSPRRVGGSVGTLRSSWSRTRG